MENITLNIIPTGVHPTCHVSQNDYKRKIRVNLVENDIPYIIQSTDKIRLNVRKPDNSVIKKQLTITSGLSYVDAEIDDNMCDVEGKNICDLQLTSSGKRISTSNFFMFVEVSPLNSPQPGPTAPSYYPKEIIDLIPEKATDNTNIVYSGYSESWGGQPYYAFNGEKNVGDQSWISQSSYVADSQYIGYKFDTPVLCNMYRLYYANSNSFFQSQRPTRFAIQGSNNNGEDWETIYEDSWDTVYDDSVKVLERTFINDTEYSWYRFLMHYSGDDQYCLVLEIELLQAVY